MALKRVAIIVLSLVLVGLQAGNLRTERAFAANTIYIRADGLISPSWVNITTFDSVTYTFTGIVNDSIVVQRDNIVIDGAGYLQNGTGSGTGISLTYRTNVTVMNLRIERFDTGLLIDDSSLCNITANTIADNDWHAIEIYASTDNIVVGNNITGNTNRGIMNNYSLRNLIANNTVNGNYRGIEVRGSSQYNIVKGNIVIDNLSGGIVVDYSKHNSIIENNVTGNPGTGITVGQSGNTTVSSNNLIDNQGYGLVVSQSPNCTIIGNEVAGNSFGISIRYLNNSLLRNNVMTNNTWNFGLYFINASDFRNDVDTSNTVNDKPICYWVEKHDQTVPTNSGIVVLFKCTNVTLQNLNISDGIWQGAVIACSTNTIVTNSYINSDEYCLQLWNASHSQISNNYLDGFIGIQLDYSSNNVVYNNTLTSGGNMGAIGLMMSSDNTFYHNNFTNNYLDVSPDGYSVNHWDNGYPDGGNYWDYYTTRFPHVTDTYSGPYQNESGSDGFWDTPYPLNENNTDNYPMIPEYTTVLTTLMFTATTTLAALVLKRRKRQTEH